MGWHWGAGPLGLYSRAYNLLMLPVRQLALPVASVAVPWTGGRYEWTDVTVPLTLADGTGDLHLALDGAVRLDWFRLERE